MTAYGADRPPFERSTNAEDMPHTGHSRTHPDRLNWVKSRHLHRISSRSKGLFGCPT